MMPPPPLPGYDLARVRATREKIVAASSIHVGTVLLGEYHEDWLLLVHSAIPDVPLPALRLSTRSLLDRLLTDATLSEFAWRVAGNIRVLKAGRPVTAWGMQLAPEWMPLAVAAAQPGRNHKDESGHWITFRILAGSACPLEVRRFWTRPASRFVSARVGFNARAGRPFAGAEHFTGMLLYGLFEPRLSDDRPGFHQVRVTARMAQHNVALIAGRAQKPCPTRGYRHACGACTIGYDRCVYALHPRTFTTGPCASCGDRAALIDPEHPERCVDCAGRKREEGEVR
jgi:hypothetical protein